MTSWESFRYLHEVLVVYYFGSDVMFTSATMLLFLLWMLASGLDVRYAVAFTLPLGGALALAGWFGTADYAINIMLLIAAVVYGVAILKIMR